MKRVAPRQHHLSKVWTSPLRPIIILPDEAGLLTYQVSRSRIYVALADNRRMIEAQATPSAGGTQFEE
jgi:hypothetical protein